MAISKIKRHRVEFRSHLGGTMLTSLWVTMDSRQEGKTVFSLLHAYPDFTPEVGWLITHEGKHYEIKSVNGKELTCTLHQG